MYSGMNSLFVIRHLYKRFGSEDRYALNDVSFTLPSKGFVAIEGKSGSGKSTLLHLMLGMLTPSKGRVLYKGKNLKDFSKRDWLIYRRYESSIVFQHYNLIPHLNALQNIALSMQIAGISRRKAYSRALKLIRKFGLEHCKDRKVHVLSGGEKQRVAICRALATKPKVIFADEPTGALDQRNALEVMDMLKQASHDALVILVSHNHELLKNYADRVLTLQDGRLIHDENRLPQDEIRNDDVHPKLSSGHWSTSFLLDNLKRNKGSVILRFISSYIGYLSILLSLGFAIGNKPALDAKKIDNLGYLTFRIAYKEYVELQSSPLRLVKQSRPELEDIYASLDSYERVSIHNDYAYFFPGSLPFKMESKSQEPCRFEPLFDISLEEIGSSMVIDYASNIVEDAYPCIVNKPFMDTYHLNVYDTFHIDYQAEIIYGGVKESVVTSLDFYIQKIVDEFTFLNSPKVYYSYSAIDAYYGNYLLENLPLRNGRYQSVSSFVASLRGDESYTNYDFLAFAHSIEEANALMAYMEQQDDHGVVLLSDAYDVAESFLSLSEALVMASMLFMMIAALSLILIIALNAYSSFLNQKKQSAILLALGAKQSDIEGFVSMEGVVINLVSISSALSSSFVLEQFLSLFLEREFGVPHLIQIPFSSLFGIPYLLVLLALLITISVSFIASIIPLKVAGRIDLSEALREE